MNVDKVATAFLGGVVTIAILTTILGRSNSAKVIDAAGSAGSNLISAALGKGAGLR